MSADSSPSSASPMPPDWGAIARYLAGESSADEARVVRGWLDAHPADRELAEQLDAAMAFDDAGAGRGADVDVEAALARVHARIHQPVDAPAARPRLTLERGNGRAPRRRAGAAIVGLIAAGVVALVVTRTRERPASAPTLAAVHSYATRVGQRDSVRLADGSRVVLGPMSRLVVPAGFGASARSVQLTGDALFEVRHDAAKPFTVRSGQAVVTDVGTTFTIESDGGESGTSTAVAVVSGSVSLRAAAAPAANAVVLAAGDRGVLDRDGQARIERHAVGEDDVAWTEGRLVFNDSPLSRVIPEMHRWYGVTLLVPDSAMLQRTVHTSFTGQSADKALEILGLTLGVRIQRHGDTATLMPPRGAVVPPSR